MDPKACLRSASDALKDSDFEAAADSLTDYYAWRRSGGYEPTIGEFAQGDNVAAVFSHFCRLKGFEVRS